MARSFGRPVSRARLYFVSLSGTAPLSMAGSVATKRSVLARAGSRRGVLAQQVGQESSRLGERPNIAPILRVHSRTPLQGRSRADSRSLHSVPRAFGWTVG